MRPVVINNQVVARESVNPPGAVRVVGAAMWSNAWINGDFLIDLDAIATYRKALDSQALGAPRDSLNNMLIHNVGKQITAANTT